MIEIRKVVENKKNMIYKPCLFNRLAVNFLVLSIYTVTHPSLMVEMDMVGNQTNIIVHPMRLVRSIPRQMDNKRGTALLEKLKSQTSLNMTIDDGNGILTFPI